MRHNILTAYRLGRIAFTVILFGTAISPCIWEVDAFPDTVVMVDPSTTSATFGSTFSVNVTVVDVENLYGLEMVLNWDSTVLTLVNVEVQLGQESGVLNTPLYIVENSTWGNRYTVSATSINPAPPFNGTGNIVRLNFSVAGVGTCKLDLQTQLSDYPPPERDPRLSLPITHIDVDGFFEGVIPEFPSYVALAIIALLTLFSVALSKHISSRHSRTFDRSASDCIHYLIGEEQAQVGII